MNQLIAIAIGGAFGAVLRFLMASGIQQWLGKAFPYGTLAVNVIGSLLLGLLTEALVLQRVTLSLEYRSAILIGFIGAFTTFSTFSLDTVYLLQNDQPGKALANIALSVISCLLAIWVGLKLGKLSQTSLITWQTMQIPYGLLLINALGAFLLGSSAAVLWDKIPINPIQQLVLLILIAACFLAFSSIYILLYVIEQSHVSTNHSPLILLAVFSNTGVCLLTMWAGYFIAAVQLNPYR